MQQQKLFCYHNVILAGSSSIFYKFPKKEGSGSAIVE